jgi:hypothetical protein
MLFAVIYAFQEKNVIKQKKLEFSSTIYRYRMKYENARSGGPKLVPAQKFLTSWRRGGGGGRSRIKIDRLRKPVKSDTPSLACSTTNRENLPTWKLDADKDDYDEQRCGSDIARIGAAREHTNSHTVACSRVAVSAD